MVENTLFGAFQQRAECFSSVVVDSAAGVFFVTVINPAVAGIVLCNFSIGPMLIGHQVCLGIDPLRDLRGKTRNAVTFYGRRANRSVAFNRHQNSLLVGALSPFVGHPLLMPGFAAKVLFIQLDDTA